MNTPVPPPTRERIFDIRSIVEQCVFQLLGIPLNNNNINDTTTFKEMGLDSLQLISLTAQLQSSIFGSQQKTRLSLAGKVMNYSMLLYPFLSEYTSYI